MAPPKFVEELQSLVQLDFDAIQAYNQAISNIDEEHIRNTLMSFKGDHERHVENLSEVIRNHGGEPPQRAKDFQGFVIEGMTAALSAVGTKAALNSMDANERITNDQYAKALDKDMPDEVTKIVRKNYEDERRHLAFIQRALDEQLWDHPERAAEEGKRATQEGGHEANV